MQAKGPRMGNRDLSQVAISNPITGAGAEFSQGLIAPSSQHKSGKTKQNTEPTMHQTPKTKALLHPRKQK